MTDQTALHLHRRRALAGDPAFFLQDAMADEVQERLEEVNRSFTDVAVVTPFPDVWRPRLLDAHIIPDADVLDLDETAFDLVIHALSLSIRSCDVSTGRESQQISAVAS